MTRNFLNYLSEITGKSCESRRNSWGFWKIRENLRKPNENGAYIVAYPHFLNFHPETHLEILGNQRGFCQKSVL